MTTPQELHPRQGGFPGDAAHPLRWPISPVLLGRGLFSLWAVVGLLLLGLQGVSELIKRVAFLQGLVPDPSRKQGAKTPEQELAEFLLQKEVAAREAALVGAQK